MKMLIAAAMLISSVSFASTPGDYGPGAYIKNTVVCYGDSSKGNQQCKNVAYKYFAARNSQYCMKEGKGGKVNCFNRKVTGNWTSSITTREERRQDEKNHK